MHVPVQLGPLVEVRVGLGEELRGEPRGDKGVDGLVQGEGEDDFMDVVCERGQVDGEGPGFGGAS